MNEIPVFKYSPDPIKNAQFTDQECQICKSPYCCLEGEYFDRGDEIESVCLNCLAAGSLTVNIPDYLQQKLESAKSVPRNSLEEFFDDLSRTPPVPWIQYNDWPVSDGDFMQYVGEWSHTEFISHSKDGNGKKFLYEILDEFTKNKVTDIDKLWDDIGRYSAVFVFKTVTSEQFVAIAQSY